MLRMKIAAPVVAAAAAMSVAPSAAQTSARLEFVGRVESAASPRVGGTVVKAARPEPAAKAACTVMMTTSAMSDKLYGDVFINAENGDWIVEWYTEGATTRVLPARCAPVLYASVETTDTATWCDPYRVANAYAAIQDNDGTAVEWGGSVSHVSYFRPLRLDGSSCMRLQSIVTYRGVLSYDRPDGVRVPYACLSRSWKVTFAPQPGDDPFNPTIKWFKVEPQPEADCFAEWTDA